MNAADMKTSDFYFELPEELIAQDYVSVSRPPDPLSCVGTAGTHVQS